MAILDLRGTHGSGKSWVPISLLAAYPHEDILEEGKAIGYSLPALGLAVVGRYRTTCGGCDGVGSADEVCRRVRLLAPLHRHVLLEGILVSHTFKRYAALAREMAAHDYKFLFLNTPLRTCIARVRARRRATGNLKPLDPTNIIKDWHGVWGRVRGQCLAAGLAVYVVDYLRPLAAIYHALGVDHAE